MGDFVGWCAVGVGICVPLPQILKLVRHSGSGVSVGTYALLCITMAGYLYHAISISDPVFVTAQAINLVTNGTILAILIRRKYANR